MSLIDGRDRLGYIDALRAVAIIGVFIAHSRLHDVTSGLLQMFVDNARFGVQLFMLVSGLTLMHAWHGRETKGLTDTPLRFIERRWFRLAPLYYSGLIFYQAMALLLGSFVVMPQGFMDISLNILLLHSWWPSSQNTVVPGGWSISVEFSFYLMFAVLVPLVRKPWHALLLLMVSGLLQSVFKDLYSILWPGLLDGLASDTRDTFLFLWPPRQMPMFVAGMLLYYLTQGPRNRGLGIFCLIWGVLGLLAMVLGKFGIVDEIMVFSLSLSMVVLGIYHWPVPLLVNGLMQYIGRISYSLYMWHFGVLALGFAVLHSYGAGLPGWLGWSLYLAFSVLASIGIAHASAKWIEQPGITLGRRILGR